MNTFELALFLVITLNFFCFSIKVTDKKVWIALGAATLLVVASHLIIEDYRWTMIPIYIISVSQLFFMVRKLVRQKLTQTQEQKKRGVVKPVLIFFLILLPALLLPAFLFPQITFEQPTGLYKVGTQTVHLIDENREEPLSPEHQHRELIIQIWYPTDKTDGEWAPYHTHGKQLSKDLEVSMGLPAFMSQSLQQARTPAFIEPSVSKTEEKYPVILYSHGLGGYRTQSMFQMTELASHGYIVVSIDHSYYSPGTVLPTDRELGVVQFPVTMHSVDMDPHVRVWSEDAQFVLNELEEMNLGKFNTDLTGKLDIDRVGYMGHSFGGATATHTLAVDARFKVGINLDGFPYGDAYIKGLEQPLMHVSADYSDSELTQSELDTLGMTAEEYQTEVMDALEERVRAINQGDHIVTIKGVSHLDFTDLPLLSPATGWLKMTGELKPRRIHQLTNQITLDFLNKHLKNEPYSILNGTQKALEEYPELVIEGSFE